MKAIVVDISGKVEIYDKALFEAMEEEIQSGEENISLTLMLPFQESKVACKSTKKLLNIVPGRYKNSTALWKRRMKGIEGILNYIFVILYVKIHSVDVLHLQWLPFLEFNGIEIRIIRLLKKLSPKTKLVLTIHNVYPHNMSDAAKESYNSRFREVSSWIDAFIVHTNTSKSDVVREFDLNPEQVYVCHHGVFAPKNVTLNTGLRKDDKLHILQFGGQSYYKGTDLLVDAVCDLDAAHKAQIETHIVGAINHDFLDELKKKDKDSVIKWKPSFLADDDLHKEINDADIIVLPYRAISQSGVLLLSIYFEKIIICSNLPSFVETMNDDLGADLYNSLFFESENVASLRKLLIHYIDKDVDESAVRERIRLLKDKYSWKSSAISTLTVYKTLTQKCS